VLRLCCIWYDRDTATASSITRIGCGVFVFPSPSTVRLASWVGDQTGDQSLVYIVSFRTVWWAQTANLYTHEISYRLSGLRRAIFETESRRWAASRWLNLHVLGENRALTTRKSFSCLNDVYREMCINRRKPFRSIGKFKLQLSLYVIPGAFSYCL